MVYQILISYNMTNEISLDVADSLEEFEKTDFWTLRGKIARKIFGHDQLYIKLIFGNTLLKDDRTLGFYKIEHLSVLLAVLKMPGGGVYQVLVNYNDKQNELFDVAYSFERFSNITILELKEKFRSKFPDAPYPKRIRMIFGNDLLEDNQTLRFYKMTHLSVLLVVMKMPGGGREDKVYQVQFEFFGWKSVFDVADSLEEFQNTTIRELRKRLELALNLKESEGRNTASLAPWEVSCHPKLVLIFGRNLEDDRTLGFYGIEHFSLLLTRLRMPGGGGGAIFPLEEVIPRTESMDRLSYSM